MLRKAEAIFMEELPLSPLYFYTNVWTNKENVKNVEVSPLGLVQYKWGYIAEVNRNTIMRLMIVIGFIGVICFHPYF